MLAELQSISAFAWVKKDPSWAIAIYAFYLAATTTVRKYVTSKSDVDYIKEEFPLKIPEL
jgi:hypothetical protein